LARPQHFATGDADSVGLRLHDSFFAVVLEAQDLFVFDRRKNRSISSFFAERFQRIRFHLCGRATMRFQSLPNKMGKFSVRSPRFWD